MHHPTSLKAWWIKQVYTDLFRTIMWTHLETFWFEYWIHNFKISSTARQISWLDFRKYFAPSGQVTSSIEVEQHHYHPVCTASAQNEQNVKRAHILYADCALFQNRASSLMFLLLSPCVQPLMRRILSPCSTPYVLAIGLSIKGLHLSLSGIAVI